MVLLALRNRDLGALPKACNLLAKVLQAAQHFQASSYLSWSKLHGTKRRSSMEGADDALCYVCEIAGVGAASGQ